ncbi:MAG: hypothetical protein RLZZ15_95 [Verrucomicrobiota bacterium]|jgi:hypothetical protein
MASQELYIRNATDTEARGPYGSEQLVSLAAGGQVTPETLVYDATAEQWVALSTNAELMAELFPEKKKLSLKAKEFKSLNQPDDKAKPISVDELLAAAEGRTDDTADRKDPEIAMMRAARLGTWSATLALAAAAVAALVPNLDTLTSGEFARLVTAPILLLGLADAGLALALGLGVVSIYPFVRFRAALGLGWLGLVFWLQGQSLPLVAVVVGSVGLYLATITVSLVPVIVAGTAAVGGMGALAWLLLR